MTYNNYSFSIGKGKFYQKSKEPKEGYEQVTYGTDNKITYHKYFDSVKGTLKYFETKEVDYAGKKLSFLEVSFINGDESHKVSVPLKNSKGNYTDEVKAIISSLDAAEVGEEYTFSMRKNVSVGANGKEYTNVVAYLNYIHRQDDNGKGLSTGYIPYTSIPKAEKEEDEDLGVTWNWKPVNKFYAQKIKEIQAKFPAAYTKQETVLEQPAEMPVATKKAVKDITVTDTIVFPDVEDDDLPF